jgi:hypothetical protein
MLQYLLFERLHTTAFCCRPFMVIAKKMQEAMEEKVDNTLLERLLERACLARCSLERDDDIAQHSGGWAAVGHGELRKG